MGKAEDHIEIIVDTDKEKAEDDNVKVIISSRKAAKVISCVELLIFFKSAIIALLVLVFTTEHTLTELILRLGHAVRWLTPGWLIHRSQLWYIPFIMEYIHTATVYLPAIIVSWALAVSQIILLGMPFIAAVLLLRSTSFNVPLQKRLRFAKFWLIWSYIDVLHQAAYLAYHLIYLDWSAMITQTELIGIHLVAIHFLRPYIKELNFNSSKFV